MLQKHLNLYFTIRNRLNSCFQSSKEINDIVNSNGELTAFISPGKFSVDNSILLDVALE